MKLRSPRLADSVIIPALLLSVLSPYSYAATLTWDGGGLSPTSPSPTAGVWNTSNAFWSNASTDSAWINANKDTARFIGAADYTVTVSGGVTVGGLIFDHTGGTVTVTGSTITLDPVSGTSVTINNSGAGNSGVTISSVLTGNTNLIKSGNNVTLSAVNTYTGSTTATGNLYLGIANALPTGTDFSISSGTFWLSGRNQTVASLAGNGTIRNHNSVSTNSVLTIDGSTDKSFTGAIGVAADTTRTLSVTKKGTSTQTFTAANLYYNGTTTISGGTLKLGTTSAINLVNTSSVLIDGGTLTNGAGDTDLGTGAVTMNSGAITPGGVGTVGSFTLAADKIFSTGGGSMNFDLGTAFDQIIGSGTGTFSIGSNTTLALTLGTGFSYSNTYNILSGFAGGSVASSITITGYDTANYTAVLGNGTTGALGTLSFTPSAVPEPGTYAAIAAASMLAFAAYRRRQKRA